MKKIENVQALRGVAVLLVVLYHLHNVLPRYTHLDLLPALLVNGYSGVDLFFLISGFVMVTVSRGRFQQPGTSIRFLSDRMSRIFPLYWLISLVILPVYLLHPEMVNSGSKTSLLHSFLLLPQDGMPLIGQGWTLILEMVFYYVFATALLLPERRLPYFLLAWATIILAGQFIPHTNAWQQAATHPLTLEFIVGALTAWLARRGVASWARSALWLGLALLGLSFFQHAATSHLDLPDGLPRALAYGIPYALILYGSVALEARRQSVYPQWLRQVGDWSYSIYLTHILVISGMARLWAKVPAGSMTYWAASATILLAVLLVGRLSYRHLEMPMLDYTRRRKRTLVAHT